MRLWHYKIIRYLPKSQLLGQWRELNSIYVKQDNHILINYVYKDEFKEDLYDYSLIVIAEMCYRKYNGDLTNLMQYFGKTLDEVIHDLQLIDTRMQKKNDIIFDEIHNLDYLTICYYNLKEKYIRGQKDFTNECWDQLNEFYKEQMLRRNDK